MKCIKIILPILAMLIIQQWASAQCTFRILSLEGASFTNQNQTIYGPYANESECERNRQYVLSNLNFSIGNHHVKATASPCSCAGISNSGFSAFGPSQGNSFYSTNAANEISDWSNDDMERMLALDKEYKTIEPTSLSTGDVDYDNARENVGNVFQSTSSTPYIGEGVFKGVPNAPLMQANTFGQANIANVNRYLENSKGLGVPYMANPQDLSLMLQRQFQSLTGYDVNAIINKMDKTDAEKQALADYNEYVKRMCDQMASEIDQQMARIDKSEEKKQIDMAILAKDCYGSGDPNYLGMTDYKRVLATDIENPYYRRIAEEIERCNATNPETGFHAVLYYNEKTDSYVIGTEGSSDSPLPHVKLSENKMPKVGRDDETGDYIFKLGNLEFRYTKDQVNDWGLNNTMQAIGRTASQFELAHNIANVINNIPEEIRKELNLSIVGHSLGGGLASVIGLVTGKPTYTYNAEGVSDNMLKEWGVLEKKQNSDYDITAYHSSTDVLTYAQQHPEKIAGIVTISGVGVAAMDLAVEATVNKEGKYENSKSDKSSNVLFAEAIGTKVNVGAQGMHQQDSMVEHFIRKNSEAQSKWERIRYSRNSILSTKIDGSLQKVDHINIIFE